MSEMKDCQEPWRDFEIVALFLWNCSFWLFSLIRKPIWSLHHWFQEGNSFHWGYKSVPHFSLDKLHLKADWGRSDSEPWEGDPGSSSQSESLGAWDPSLILQSHPRVSRSPVVLCHGPWWHLVLSSYCIYHILCLSISMIMWCLFISLPDCMLPKDGDCMSVPSHCKPSVGHRPIVMLWVLNV